MNIVPICETLLKKLEQIAKNCFPSCKTIKAALYGSMATGLALLTSDIDIALLGAPMTGGLERLEEILANEKYVISHKVISTARVPVMKLVVNIEKLHSKSIIPEIKVDVIIGVLEDKPDQVSSALNSIKFVDWAKTRMKENPELKPIVLMIKKLLANNQLNIPYHGMIIRNNRWYEFLRHCSDGVSISKYAFKGYNAWTFIYGDAKILRKRI